MSDNSSSESEEEKEESKFHVASRHLKRQTSNFSLSSRVKNMRPLSRGTDESSDPDTESDTVQEDDDEENKSE